MDFGSGHIAPYGGSFPDFRPKPSRLEKQVDIKRPTRNTKLVHYRQDDIAAKQLGPALGIRQVQSEKDSNEGVEAA